MNRDSVSPSSQEERGGARFLFLYPPGDMIRIEREDDGRRGRFVIYEDELYAGEMTYGWQSPTTIAVDHTGVESSFGGKGYGRRLIEAGVAFARREGLKIVPVCSFVRKAFERDASLADVKA